MGEGRNDSGTKGGNWASGAQTSWEPLEDHVKGCDVLPPQGQRSGGVDPPTPVSHGWRTIPGGVNSLGLLTWSAHRQRGVSQPERAHRQRAPSAGSWA